MKAITRNHKFENRLNFVQRGRKYFYLWHEKSESPVRIQINDGGKIAFQNEDWNYFMEREAEFFGGTL